MTGVPKRGDEDTDTGGRSCEDSGLPPSANLKTPTLTKPWAQTSSLKNGENMSVV